MGWKRKVNAVDSNSSSIPKTQFEVDKMSEEEKEAEKKKIYKNVFLISIAFFFNFNAYGSLARLQSSLHIDEGMGTITQSALYGALVISCFFMPKLIINYLGHKWTIAVSFTGYILWMVANGYAVWATMIPASILVGLCAAPLWTAQCSYFIVVGQRYADLTQETETQDVVVARFFGIFFCFLQMSSISGSIISSTTLRPQLVNKTEDDPTDWELQFCGIHDCPDNNITNPNLAEVEDDVLWTMLIVYIAIAILAVIVVSVFVDNLADHLQSRSDNSNTLKDQTLQLMSATARNLRHREQLLLIPLTMYSGFEMTFYGAEFSKSFIRTVLTKVLELLFLTHGCSLYLFRSRRTLYRRA